MNALDRKIDFMNEFRKEDQFMGLDVHQSLNSLETTGVTVAKVVLFRKSYQRVVV